MDKLQESIIKDLEGIKALPDITPEIGALIDTLLNPLKVGQGSKYKLATLRILVNNMKKEIDKEAKSK